MTLIPNPYAGPARALRESGGTVLPMGAVSEGQFLKRVGTDIVGAAVSSIAGLESNHIASGVISDIFLSFGQIAAFTAGNGLGINTLRAKPLVVGRDCTLSSLGLIVATGVATSVCRVGIYAAGSDGYPTTLLVESGEIDCSTNTRKLTTGLSQALSAGVAYWVAFLGGVAAPNLARTNTAVGFGQVVCASGSIAATAVTEINVAQSYGTMPTIFPSGAATGASATTMPVPLLGVT